MKICLGNGIAWPPWLISVALSFFSILVLELNMPAFYDFGRMGLA